MIAKMIMATASEPRATKPPKVAITTPASPLVSIRRVVAVLRTRRYNVKPSKSEGKEENSSGPFMYITVSRTTPDKVMLMSKSRSIIPVGKGIRITRTRLSTAAGNRTP